MTANTEIETDTATPPAVQAVEPGAEGNVYIYAVARAGADLDLAFKPVSAPGDEPFLVACGPLTVIASPIDVDEVLSTRRNMLGHAKALETLMARADVLPMRFGLITAEVDRIRATIAANEDPLLAALDDLAGAVECGIKVSWDRETAMREVVAARPELQSAYKALAARSATETHYQRIELGRKVDAALETKRTEERHRLIERLEPLTRSLAFGAPEDEMMVLKADALLDRVAQADLVAALEAVEAEAPGRLTVKIVGPGPAYSFVSLQLAWAAPNAVEPAALAG
ncbi:MAG: GvpL/GvpF family gas vesicle protein [Pseudomonadota bacterium]